MRPPIHIDEAHLVRGNHRDHVAVVHDVLRPHGHESRHPVRLTEADAIGHDTFLGVSDDLVIFLPKLRFVRNLGVVRPWHWTEIETAIISRRIGLHVGVLWIEHQEGQAPARSGFFGQGPFGLTPGTAPLTRPRTAKIRTPPICGEAIRSYPRNRLIGSRSSSRHRLGGRLRTNYGRLSCYYHRNDRR